MSLIRDLIQFTYPVSILFNIIRKNVINERKGRLRVLIFHDIPPSKEYKFQSLLTWLSKKWNFVTPYEFCGMMGNKGLIKGNNLLITFDDGFLSNYIVAEKVLKPMGIQALFFVVSDFIDITDKNNAHDFIAKNILPNTPQDQISDHLVNMGWGHLRKLINAGHTIGAHTKTHKRLSNCNPMILHGEIIDSIVDLEKNLGIKIEHFAFTFGDINSMPKEGFEIARSRFKYIYTGLRGDNAKNAPIWAIRRDPVQLKDTRFLTGAFLEGVVDKYYQNDLEKIFPA